MGFKTKFLCRLLLCFTVSLSNTIVTCESIQLSQLLDMQSVQPAPKDLETRAISTSCGGVLRDEIGGINFKLDSPLGANVSCLWIIHVEGSSEILLNVTKSFFAPGEQEIFQYGYFNNSNYHNENDFVWKSFNKESPDSRTVKGPTVFVHLAAYGRSPSLGFSLSYNATRTVQTKVLYINEHVAGDYGAAQFAVEDYKGNSSLRYIRVIQPSLSSTQNYGESLYFLRMKLVDGRENCVGNETDTISVYRYGSSWNKVQGYCGSQSKTPGIPFSTEEGRNNPIIVTFKSDSTVRTQSKFEYFWNYHSSGATSFFSTFYTPILLFSTLVSSVVKFSN